MGWVVEEAWKGWTGVLVLEEAGEAVENVLEDAGVVDHWVFEVDELD